MASEQGPAAARLRGVGVNYAHAGVDALVDVDLTVGVGERVALRGPCGSGKTTVLDVLAGLRAPDVGSATVLGADPNDLTGRARRRHGQRVGTVGQHHDLALALRVIHNINAGRLGSWSTSAALRSLIRPAARADVTEVLASVGLADRIDAATGELSGGERQRVAVARVVHQRADLVLADEPTSSVDPALADQVLDVLLASASTTIVSLHDPALARRHVDRVVGMRAGRLVLDRPTPDVGDADIASLYGSPAER